MNVKGPALLPVCQETSSALLELQMEVAMYLFALQCHLNLILVQVLGLQRMQRLYLFLDSCFNELIECAFTMVPQHVLTPRIITTFSLLAWIINSLMNGINFLIICYS